MDKVFVLYNPLSNNKQGFEDSQALKATAYDKDLEYVDITKISNYKNFFNSLKETYFEFNKWFNNKRKNNNYGYVTYNDNILTSLLILKIELLFFSYNFYSHPFHM